MTTLGEAPAPSAQQPNAHGGSSYGAPDGEGVTLCGYIDHGAWLVVNMKLSFHRLGMMILIDTLIYLISFRWFFNQPGANGLNRNQESVL